MKQELSGRSPRRRCRTRLSGLGLVLSLGIASGCGASDPGGRQPISGFVTFDGQAIEEGAILLEPFGAGGPGTAVGATIRRGTFAIARDRGPTPGSYRVRIYSGSGVQAPPLRGQTERTRRPMVERLPEVYNTRSQLRMDVVAGASNRLRLDLLAADGG